MPGAKEIRTKIRSIRNTQKITKAMEKGGERDGRTVDMLLFAGVVYFVICFFASQLVRRLQKRASI